MAISTGRRQWKWNETKPGRCYGPKLHLVKIELNTQRLGDSDGADHSSQETLQKVEGGCRSGESKLAVLNHKKTGITGAGRISQRRYSGLFRVHIIIGEATIIGIPIQRLAAAKATGAIIFQTDQGGQIRLPILPAKN